LSDLQGHSPVASLFKWDFAQVIQQLTRFQHWYIASRCCNSWAFCKN